MLKDGLDMFVKDVVLESRRQEWNLWLLIRKDKMEVIQEVVI